ncbi:hypothetical protein Tco_1113458 [Tanacetum coccineum]|uniref:Reverse transcriptase n=1 Tax=Tanacetum coccineum TaxID=301880 RepID=A0ABQ5ISB8_9ASTR
MEFRDESIDTSSHINVNAIEKVADSIKENSIDDLNDLNDNLNELAHGINEDEVQMDNPNTTTEQLQFFEKEKDHNDFNSSKVSESSDLSHPPGFEHMKKSLSNTSLIDLPIGGRLRIRKHDAMSYVKSVEKRIKDGIATPSDRDTRMQLLQEIDKLDNFEALNLIQKALHSEYLENHVSLDEIKSAIWDCGSNKAPGPDGFTFAFVKKYWDLIKMDILEFVNSFFYSCSMPKGVNSSFFTLIPKVSNSNPFEVLNLVDNDVELGTNGGTTNFVNNEANSSGSFLMYIDSSSTGTTPIIDKIKKFEDLLSSGQAILLNNASNPLKNVELSGDYDSEDEVASVDNDMTRSLASERVGFGTQSLLKQWKDSYGHGDYDDDLYDDDMYEGQDVTQEIQAICDNLMVSSGL